MTKEERKKYHKEWREKHKEQWKAYGKKWKDKNKERVYYVNDLWAKNHSESRKAYNKKWKDQNKEKIAQQQRARLLRYKTMVVEAYGGGCTCCGEKFVGFLTVEHLRKNGKEHRKEVRGNFYYYLVKNNFPKADLAILCMNCNWYERKGNTCPHRNTPLNSTSVVTKPESPVS